MALPRKQTITVPLVSGIDGGTDSRLLPAPNLQNLINGVYNKKGLVEKRPGFYRTSTNTRGTESISSVVATAADTLLGVNDTGSTTYPVFALPYAPSDTITSHADTGVWGPTSAGYLPDFVGWRRFVASGSGPQPASENIADDNRPSAVQGSVFFPNTVYSPTKNWVIHVWATSPTAGVSATTPTSVHLRIEDTKGALIDQKLLFTPGAGELCKLCVVCIEAAVFIFYITSASNELKYYSLNLNTSPYTEYTGPAILGSLNAGPTYPMDVCPIYDDLSGASIANGLIVAAHDASVTVGIGTFRYTIGLSSNQYQLTLAASSTRIGGTTDISALALWAQTSGGSETATTWLFWADYNADEIRGVGYRQDTLAVTVAQFTAHSSFGFDFVRALAIARVGGTAVHFAYSGDYSSGPATILGRYTVGAGTSHLKVLPSFTVHSRLFSKEDFWSSSFTTNHRIFAVLYNACAATSTTPSYTEGGYHVVEVGTPNEPNILVTEVCRLAPRQATDRFSAALSPSYPLPVPVSRLTNFSFVFPGLVDVAAQQGAFSALYLDFGERPTSNLPGLGCGQSKWRSINVNGTTLICGGKVCVFDGFSVHELGLSTPPNPAYCSATTVAGSGVLYSSAGNSYGYAAVYIYEDAAGTIHRSAPTFFTSQNPANRTNCPIEVKVPPLHLSDKYGTAATYSIRPISIDLYRTKNQLTTYYFLARFDSPTSGGLRTFTDDTGDAYIGTQPTLYTQGGVQESQCPPSATFATQHKNCVWLSGCDDMRQIWISKPLEPGIAPEFNDGRVLVMPENILAAEAMDQCVYAFARHRVYRIVGDPPNAVGEGGTLQYPEALPNSFGCKNPRSIVLTEAGIVFESDRGLMLLGRGGNIVALDQANDLLQSYPEILHATTDPVNNSQVTFSVTDGDVGRLIIWDVARNYWGLWNVNDGVVFNKLAVWRSRLVGAPSDSPYLYIGGGELGVTSDLGSWIELRFRLPELHLGDMLGFQRVWKCKLLGRGTSPCKVYMSEYTDYGTSANQTLSKDLTAAAPAKTELELYFKNQRCQSASVEVYDAAPTGWAGTSGGQGIYWNGALFEVGVEPGSNRTYPSGRAT